MRSQSPHDRSPSPGLPLGVSEISDRDYFIKIPEFRVWLKEEKGKVCLPFTPLLPWRFNGTVCAQYFDELTGEKARR
jgi:hypothetical protein